MSIITPKDEIARYITVLVGGVDITYLTYKIDLTHDIAYCYMRDERNGSLVMADPDTLATVEYSRGVEVYPAQGAPDWVAPALEKMREEVLFE